MSAFSTPTSLPRQWSSPAIGHKAALSATSTPLLDNIQGNDDEQERRQRRRSKVIDLHGVADCSINEAGSHRFVETQCSAPFKKKKKKKKAQCTNLFLLFCFSTIVLQLHQLLSQSCHRHRYLSIIQPASSFPLKMWVKIDVCWLYCIFPALCSSEMNDYYLAPSFCRKLPQKMHLVCTSLITWQTFSSRRTQSSTSR